MSGAICKSFWRRKSECLSFHLAMAKLHILGIAHYSIPSTPAASWMASFQQGICDAWHQGIVFECRISVCVTLSKKALLHLKDCCVLFCGMYTSVIIFVCAESGELVYRLSALFWVPLSNCRWEFLYIMHFHHLYITSTKESWLSM